MPLLLVMLLLLLLLFWLTIFKECNVSHKIMIKKWVINSHGSSLPDSIRQMKKKTVCSSEWHNNSLVSYNTRIYIKIWPKKHSSLIFYAGGYFFPFCVFGCSLRKIDRNLKRNQRKHFLWSVSGNININASFALQILWTIPNKLANFL